jgi:hypothetical protein
MLPVDEASQDPEFFAFRARLIDLLKEKDVEGVVANACPQVQIRMDGPTGLDVLRDHLSNEGSWEELLGTLSMGGRFTERGGFLAPYTMFADIPEIFDLYTTFVVTGSDVLLRDTPSKDGAVIGSLSYNIVTVPRLSDTQYEDIYLPVERPGGTIGYVHRDYLRGVVGPRVSFEKDEQGVWKMCGLYWGA